MSHFKCLAIFSYVFGIASVICLIEAIVLESKKYRIIIEIMYVLFVIFALFSVICAALAKLLYIEYLRRLVNVAETRPDLAPQIINILR